jgi:hypothetical protein
MVGGKVKKGMVLGLNSVESCVEYVERTKRFIPL